MGGTLRNKLTGNSRGQVGDAIIALFVISFIIYFNVAYTSGKAYFKAQRQVDGIVKNHVDIMRKKGVLTSQNYSDMIRELSYYGGFDIYLRVDCVNDIGGYDSFFTEASILDRRLKLGDYVSVYVESAQNALFGEILSRNLMFGPSGSHINLTLNSSSSGMVMGNGS